MHSLKSALALLSIMGTFFASAEPAMALLKKGEPAPGIKVVTISGQQVTLENYRGYVLVLDFFATWCVPCRQSIPHLISLNSRYGKEGLQILGMNIEEGENLELKGYVAEQKINYPVASANEQLRTEYGLRSVPTIFVISRRGIVAEKYQGYNDNIQRSMDILIKKLLAE